MKTIELKETEFTLGGLKIKELGGKPKPTKPHYPVMTEDGFFPDSVTAEIWMMATEDWEWGQLGFVFDSHFPPDHAVEYEMGNSGCDFDEYLVDDVMTFLLQEGIAPYQPFFACVHARYFEEWTYYGKEWDLEFDFEVLDVKKWSVDKAATAWEAFFARTRMLLGGDGCRSFFAQNACTADTCQAQTTSQKGISSAIIGLLCQTLKQLKPSGR